MGADPKTVRRYVRAAERVGMKQDDGVGALDDEHFLAVLEALKTPAPRPGSKGRRLCEEKKSFIEKKLAQRVRRALVHRLLQRQGVLINYSMLNRFAVEELDFGKKAATLPVIDGEPGKELQLDTGQFLLPEPDESGRRRRVKASILRQMSHVIASCTSRSARRPRMRFRLVKQRGSFTAASSMSF